MLVAEICSTIEEPWLGLEPVRIGRVPEALSTPARYVTVDSDDGPALRIELYGSGKPDCYAFEAAQV